MKVLILRQVHIMNKVNFHIPINTKEQVIVRDEIAKFFMAEYGSVVLHFTEMMVDVNREIKLLPISVVSVYSEKITDNDVKFFKEMAVIISEKVGDSVLLEITKEITYIGTANIKEE